jgi:hypothetical protein
MEDYMSYLGHYMFAAGCRSENLDQFIKFIGIVASMDWSATPTLDPRNYAKWLTVAPPLVTVATHKR